MLAYQIAGFAMLGAYVGFSIGTLALTAAFANSFLAELQHDGEDLVDLHARIGLAFADLVDQREDGLLDEVDQALEHLRLAREVPV